MAIISITLPSDGNTGHASDVNTPFTTIVNDYNGNIDNTNIKSGAGINGSKLANSSVTADKLATGAQTANVAAGETTASTSYVDLATVTDTVTATIGANGLALVILTCEQNNNTNSALSYMSFAASGANTIAASDVRAFVTKISGATADILGSFVYLATGLTPGSTTFKAKYRVGAGTGTFSNRYITVIPL